MKQRIVTVAARNVRPGDLYINKSFWGGEQLVLKVERVDWEDRVEVRVTVRDNSTWVPSEYSFTLRPYHTIQVRKGGNPENIQIDWSPRCY